MPDGSCLCGKSRIHYTGEVLHQWLCHCSDCRKISGSTYSTNIIVDGDSFSILNGEHLKEISAKGSKTGNTITGHFCGNCGTTLWRDGSTLGNKKVIKVGVLDDAELQHSAKPAMELWAPDRMQWLEKIPGAVQRKDMPDSEVI